MPEQVKSSNFSFLAVHDAQLVRLGALAERYFKDDPATCLIKLRQYGETLAQLVAAKAGLFHDTQEPQAARCQVNLAYQRHIQRSRNLPGPRKDGIVRQEYLPVRNGHRGCLLYFSERVTVHGCSGHRLHAALSSRCRAARPYLRQERCPQCCCVSGSAGRVSPISATVPQSFFYRPPAKSHETT